MKFILNKSHWRSTTLLKNMLRNHFRNGFIDLGLATLDSQNNNERYMQATSPQWWKYDRITPKDQKKVKPRELIKKKNTKYNKASSTIPCWKFHFAWLCYFNSCSLYKYLRMLNTRCNERGLLCPLYNSNRSHFKANFPRIKNRR